MNAQTLQALSPLDGRYSKAVSSVKHFFSEYALIKYRLQVEVEYLIFFLQKTKLQKLSAAEQRALRNIYVLFNEPAAVRVKELEEKCHHDVKAVEYFLQEELQKEKLERLIPYIHVGLTSEDTNSCAYGLAISQSLNEVMIPTLSQLIATLSALANSTADTVMLARTHGQPAVPTTFGKEVQVFVGRLEKTLHSLQQTNIEAKLSGAVGNWNALAFVLPHIEWPRFSQEFIQGLGLHYNSVTTQIIPAESYAECFQVLVRVNGIMIDCARDFWQYISDNYLIQHVEKEHVGSSTMPQKVNPIMFENSEGNAGVAIALLQHFIEKLPISRLQRDLSDSTVKRSIGTAFGHTLLAMTSLNRGLQNISPNTELMQQVVNDHPEVLAEALQTALRLSGTLDAYEKIKDKTRGQKITKKDLDAVAQEITDPELRKRFVNLQPSEYVGVAQQLVTKKVSIKRGANAKK